MNDVFDSVRRFQNSLEERREFKAQEIYNASHDGRFLPWYTLAKNDRERWYTRADRTLKDEDIKILRKQFE
jgi:hypothetical protein